MRSPIIEVLVLAALASGVGCATITPPAARAAGVERVQCDAAATNDGERILRSTTVLRSDPIYTHMITGNNNSEDRVAGAKLLVRPPDGVTAELMVRTLQCHSARVLLGQVSGALVPNDPYWLPDAWVDIDVKPEDGNFAVTLSSDSIRDNLALLGRARHYASDHALATEPALP
jgi:hypothetical protein